VRDTLLGNPVKDIDAATPHEPDAVVDLLGKAGIRTVPTGIDHGTVTALLPGGPVEVTTLRRDVSTDGRRATVAFATDWREDAARRDFTINALYAHPDTLEIEDYFGGLADLDARRVRFIGDARQRIREDHLRILRYYRFQARFGSALDAEAEDACVELAPTLKGSAANAWRWNCSTCWPCPIRRRPSRGWRPAGSCRWCLPEAARPGSMRLRGSSPKSGDRVSRPTRCAGSPRCSRRPATCDQVAARLRLSAAQRKRLATAAARTGDPGDARALAYRLGRDEALDRLLLAGASLAPLAGWDIPVFPIKGGAIVARGVLRRPRGGAHPARGRGPLGRRRLPRGRARDRAARREAGALVV
jgi:poly(A) polymerase